MEPKIIKVGIFVDDLDSDAREEAEVTAYQECARQQKSAQIMHRNPRWYDAQQHEGFDLIVIRPEYDDVITAYEEKGSDVIVMGSMETVDKNIVREVPATQNDLKAVEDGADFVDQDVVSKVVAMSITGLKETLPTIESVPFLMALREAEEATSKPRSGALDEIDARIAELGEGSEGDA